MSASRIFWAREQVQLRKTLDAWIAEEVNRYEEMGFEGLFGSTEGHRLDEAGGYTRSFAAAYCLSGDPRIVTFMKRFRDDWYDAVTASGHLYHGYDSNEKGDYITHTAEAFSQFLLNVLYLDLSDETSMAMVEDAAEHLGNWNPEVQDWYDWDNHVFLSYFLGTRSPYHKPPYNFQTTRHFRVLQIAVAAYEATQRQRYLDLCVDYCDNWCAWILSLPEDEAFQPRFLLITPDELRYYAQNEPYRSDWRFYRYHRDWLQPENKTDEQQPKLPIRPRHHLPHDLMMTWLEIYKHVPKPEYKEALRRVMADWIALGEDYPSQIAGREPHCGIHLPKYRDFTGDTTLDDAYLKQWENGPCSYLLTGEEERLIGTAAAAEAVFDQAVLRNTGLFGEQFATTHACSPSSTAGTSSAYVAPALFTPAFGGLNVHFGRAPWVKVLYYVDGAIGLPADMAALYVPAMHGRPAGVQLANLGAKTRRVGVCGPLVLGRADNLALAPQAPSGLQEVDVMPDEVRVVSFA